MARDIKAFQMVPYGFGGFQESLRGFPEETSGWRFYGSFSSGFQDVLKGVSDGFQGVSGGFRQLRNALEIP